MSRQPTFTLLEDLISQTKAYVDNRLELLKLQAVDKTSKTLSAIVSIVVLSVVFLIFFIVLNIGIALLIGDLLGKSYLGFLILAGVYAIVGFILLKKRKRLFKEPITGMILRKVYKP